MQSAIVPYSPPAMCSARAGHSRNFAEWLRRGGRVQPIALSASGGDPEAMLPTTRAPNESIQIAKAANRQARATQFAVVVALILLIVVFAGLGVVVWRVNENIASLQNFIQPHASHILNETLGILEDTSGSLHNVYEVSSYTSQLAAVAGGASGSASATLNSASATLNHTAIITQQLENFLKHPTLQLSLGGGST